MKNLKDLDVSGVNEETLILKGEFTKEIEGRINHDKEWRRQAITNGDVDGKKYNIVMLVGDNLNDLSSDFETSFDNEKRQSHVHQQSHHFGITNEPVFPVYIMLPNPLYGDWEGGLYDPSEFKKNIWFQMTPTQKDSQRRRALIRWE
jgi:predicted secreted acid phosphatase